MTNDSYWKMTLFVIFSTFHHLFTKLIYFSHNAELFSKGAFSMGKYRKLDMSELNMTNERDYAAYMALVSSGQGSHSDRALANLQQSLGNQTWAQYCSTRTNLRTH